ncbi:hypothetical protein C2S51_016165 [Perilla frutescens var. frutescens]|nr:hypothetical protein C2S51_016165 [Perilla frutescens var. frutescens]
MLPTIYCHPTPKRPHPQGSSSSDHGTVPLEDTISSTDEKELMLENASLLRLSDQPTISASSQPPPSVHSDYIEVDFEAVLDHQLRSYFGLIEDTDYSLFAEGTWSRNWINHPLSSPPMLSKIMDSMIKRLQLGISADAPLPDNEPANSSCAPFVGDPPLPSSDEIFTSLANMSFREQDISDPAHDDNLATAFTFLPNFSLPSCDHLHLLADAKKGEDGQNDDGQYNGCMTLWDQIQRELQREIHH